MPVRPVGRAVIYDMYAYAKAIEVENRVAFAEAFTRAFDEAVPRLNDHDAYVVTRWLEVAPGVLSGSAAKCRWISSAPRTILDNQMQSGLIWAYLSFSAFRTFGSLVVLLVAEDDDRRYAIMDDVPVKTSGGTSISVRWFARRTYPKRFRRCSSSPATTLNIRKGVRRARLYRRGGLQPRRATSPRSAVPYQREGDDARAVINWIAKQPWSDGRVGMYGEGYSGYSAWAAANACRSRSRPSRLRQPPHPASIFRWRAASFKTPRTVGPLYMTHTKESVETDDYDDAMWRALDQKWYLSGSRYRDLGRLYNQPNPIFNAG